MSKLKQINKGAPHLQDRVYDVGGVAPALNTVSGGGQTPYIEIKNATKNGSLKIENGGVMNIAYPESKTRRGRAVDGGNTSPTLDTGCQVGVVALRKRENGQEAEERKDGVTNTITSVQKDNYITDEVRIRKLTPRECFRLQGFPDEYFNRAAEVNSDSQLYKQAGNSVTVNVIYEIAKRLPK